MWNLDAELLDAAHKHFYASTESGFVKIEAGMVMGIGEILGRISGAEEEITARDFL